MRTGPGWATARRVAAPSRIPSRALLSWFWNPRGLVIRTTPSVPVIMTSTPVLWGCAFELDGEQSVSFEGTDHHDLMCAGVRDLLAALGDGGGRDWFWAMPVNLPGRPTMWNNRSKKWPP